MSAYHRLALLHEHRVPAECLALLVLLVLLVGVDLWFPGDLLPLPLIIAAGTPSILLSVAYRLAPDRLREIRERDIMGATITDCMPAYSGATASTTARTGRQ